MDSFVSTEEQGESEADQDLASPGLDEALEQHITELILELDSAPKGRSILSPLKRLTALTPCRGETISLGFEPPIEAYDRTRIPAAKGLE